MASDWDDFLADAVWRPRRKAKVEVGATTSPPSPQDETRECFPTLCKLVAAARATPVSINGTSHVLLGWTNRDGKSTGWFCRDALSDSDAVMLHESHRVLGTFFGGIVERWNESADTWLLNHNEVLTAALAREPLAPDFAAYEWAFEGRGVPIDVNEWYGVAQEANGNVTICNRASGDVLLFAPDHSFDHVVPLEGCPPYTLYRIKGASTLAAWVERIAEQWLASIAR